MSRFTNLKKAPEYKVSQWLEESLNLTEDQKRKMHDDEVLRWSPFDFFEDKPKTENVWLRFTIIFIPFVWLILFISLPVNYIISGQWGYGYEKLKWYDNWTNKLGI